MCQAWPTIILFTVHLLKVDSFHLSWRARMFEHTNRFKVNKMNKPKLEEAMILLASFWWMFIEHHLWSFVLDSHQTKLGHDQIFPGWAWFDLAHPSGLARAIRFCTSSGMYLFPSDLFQWSPTTRQLSSTVQSLIFASSADGFKCCGAVPFLPQRGAWQPGPCTLQEIVSSQESFVCRS